MQTQTQKLSEFIANNRITMTCERADRNPLMGEDMDHWKCRLASHATNPLATGRMRTMTVVFSQGYGHHGAEPELAGVLDCLASDADGVENARSFEDWCSEYGYDTDSRKAEKIFKACERNAAKLKAFLGDEMYQALLWNTERE